MIFSSPALDQNGTVYVGSNDNKLYAYNSDGTVKWDFTTGNWVDSSPTIGPNGTIYVGSWDNKLYALNQSDGSKLWDFNTSSSIIASPAVASNGNIYFGSKRLVFYALNSSGTKLWEYFKPVNRFQLRLLLARMEQSILVMKTELFMQSIQMVRPSGPMWWMM